ncbi:MAG TPA: sigma-70 family RNA polymerase sigma factor [Acidimicrobiales bacterium]
MGRRRPAARARTDTASDADELTALAAGDHGAFTRLFARHGSFVYNVAFRRTASWSVAEDITGTVFLELWRQRGRVEPLGGSLRPWLAGVAVNQARQWGRHGGRQARALDRLAQLGPGGVAGRAGGPGGPDGPDPGEVVPRRIDDEARMAALLRLVASLPAPQRDVLTLWAWEQLGYEEIAAALGLPVGTVRSRLHRARARLRALEGTGAGDRASTSGPPDRAVEATGPRRGGDR